MLGVCETFGLSHQVRPEAHARGPMFASSAFAIRNGFRARFRATYRNIIRRLIRMGGASVMRRLAGWDRGRPAAPRRSP